VRRHILATAVALLLAGHLPASAAGAGPTPNYYKLDGGGVHVVYSLANRGGTASLTYKDEYRTLRFGPGRIRTAKTEIGTLVTVTTYLTVDTGSTTFTLVVPDVNLGPKPSVPIRTLGITTVHHFSVNPRPGQVEEYATTALRGTAQERAVPLG
jgi:hypothetical protein